MATFLAHPAPRTLTYRPGGAHPTAYLRIHILAEMLKRLGFRKDGELLREIWERLYSPRRFHRLPVRLLATSEQMIPHVVDEIAFQTRRNLAQRALVDIIPFRPEDERAIRDGVRVLAQGGVPRDLAPRHLVSAASYTLAQGRIEPGTLATRVIRHLTESGRAGGTLPARVPLAA